MSHRIVLLVSLLVVAGSCKKKSDEAASAPAAASTETGTKEDAPGKDEPGEAKTPDYSSQEAKVERFKECWTAFVEGKSDEFKGCYADKTEFRMKDQVPEMAASDPQGVAALTDAFRAAFPDMKVEHQLILINGNKMAGITFQSGTHSGDFHGIPATGKKTGLLQAQVGSIGDDGKVTRDHHITDQLSMLNQLGVLPEEAAARSAAALEKGWDETFEVVAKNDESEAANVKVVKDVIASVEKGDVKAVVDGATDDVGWHYVAGNEGAKTGKDAYEKALGEFVGMTSERKLEINDIWAAGNWVVAEVSPTLTIGIDFPGMKTKGKSATQNEIHFFELADGKIKRHLLFANDMSMAVQLGMLDPAAMAAGKGAGNDAPTKAAE